jgi:hypothetical protein
MKTKQKSKKRFEKVKPYPKVITDFIAAGTEKPCEAYALGINRNLKARCEAKNFVIESGRPCAGGGGAATPVDLVVVIDTSGSMLDEASDLSQKADDAISAAAASCPCNLRVKWFGIEGIWSGTKFNQSYREYLHGLSVPDTAIVGTLGDTEDGAAAIIDISEHFDWRPNALRAVFYLGDEALEGGNPQNADDVTAANNAIAAANSKAVKVFTYAGTGVMAATQSEYARVAADTGGTSFVHPSSNFGGFKSILEQIICQSSQGGCGPVKIPAIRPCFVLTWGDGPRDQIETDDYEIICITACNPYSNVTLKGLEIVISVITDKNGNNVPDLPDGTPSVFIKPSNFICFGDIGPCDPKKPDEFSCVSREVVLISRGAKRGKYVFHIGYCFTVEMPLKGADKFKFELVRS